MSYLGMSRDEKGHDRQVGYTEIGSPTTEAQLYS